VLSCVKVLTSESFDLGLHLCKSRCGWDLLSSPWDYWSHSVPLRQERNNGDSLRRTCVRCRIPRGTKTRRIYITYLRVTFESPQQLGTSPLRSGTVWTSMRFLSLCADSARFPGMATCHSAPKAMACPLHASRDIAWWNQHFLPPTTKRSSLPLTTRIQQIKKEI
jgi:hypothetical protein